MASAVVGVVMGSTSDLELVKETFAVLKEFGIPYEANVLSAHRTPDETIAYAKSAYDRGIRVLIAAAGGAAHLAGILAGCTSVPVIGIPMPSGLDGMDSLLSIVQMPAGVPVATVAIGKAGCRNAAILAAEILATADPAMHETILAYKEKMRQKVLASKAEA